MILCKVIIIIAHLVPFACAKPATTLLGIVEREVKALSHPIPITSHLIQTCMERQITRLLRSFVI